MNLRNALVAPLLCITAPAWAQYPSPTYQAVTTLANTTVGGILGVTGNATVGGTLGVTGNATINGLLQGATLLTPNGAIRTVVPGVEPTNNYAIFSNSTLTGSADRFWNLYNFVTSVDLIQAPGVANGVNWVNIVGNVGANSWRPSTSYALNVQANNGGRIYKVTTAGTSAGSGGPTGTGTGIVDGTVVWAYVSNDFNGKRAAISATINFNGQNSTVPDDGSRQFQSGIFTTTVSAPQGGTSPHSGSSAGFFYAAGDQMWCFSGAINLSGCIGHEIDVGLFTGSSAASRVGLQIVSFGDLQGSDVDIGLRLGAINSGSGFSPGFLNAIGLQENAVAQNGTILGYIPSIGLSAAGTSDIPPIAALGIDLAAYNMSTGAFRSAGGFLIDGLGSADIGSVKMSTNGATSSIDASGSQVSAAAISNAGSGYVVGDQLYHPSSGTIVTVSSVSAGAITGLTLTVKGATTGSPPSNPVTLLGGTGAGATATLTWVAATTLNLNPSGNTLVGSGSALSTSATSGFPLIPTAAGVPSGTIGAAGQGAIIINTASHKICHSEGGGTWYDATGAACS